MHILKNDITYAEKCDHFKGNKGNIMNWMILIFKNKFLLFWFYRIFFRILTLSILIIILFSIDNIDSIPLYEVNFIFFFLSQSSGFFIVFAVTLVLRTHKIHEIYKQSQKLCYNFYAHLERRLRCLWHILYQLQV